MVGGFSAQYTALIAKFTIQLRCNFPPTGSVVISPFKLAKAKFAAQN